MGRPQRSLTCARSQIKIYSSRPNSTSISEALRTRLTPKILFSKVETTG